ncbi:hypothetical protein [Streptomyces sp. NPDC059080]|uniref:hypothetical protein n=1 Tax=Streptomyces sp. NPDC059080 TaxID=3346718 RepID=UPI0036BEB679
MRRRLRAISALTAAASFFLWHPAAHAHIDGGVMREKGHSSQLTAQASQTKVKITGSGGSPGTGRLTPADPDWTPPPCWYEPIATPKQFKESVQKLKKTEGLALANTYMKWDHQLFEEKYKKKGQHDLSGGELSKYGDYNISQQGKGMWYRGILNPHAETGMRDDERGCRELIHWVPNGSPPPYPESISPKILAGYAYSSVRIPETAVSLNPDGKQTVNLPTWIWLDDAKFTPVSVTASLPGTGLWATTTATPVGLHLDPGTNDADLSPSSGTCPMHDGRIGQPYTKGSGLKPPPCGVTYRHSTAHTGPYRLKATLTWQVSWKGSGGAGGTLPEGTFGTDIPLHVQEAQAVNR